MCSAREESAALWLVSSQMISSQPLEIAADASYPRSFHRSLGQLVVAPVLHVMQGQVPKLREVIRGVQESCRDTVTTIKSVERRVQEAFATYNSVSQATESVEDASQVVEAHLARVDHYKKPLAVVSDTFLVAL